MCYPPDLTRFNQVRPKHNPRVRMVRDIHGIRCVRAPRHRVILHQGGRTPRSGDGGRNQSRDVEVCHHRVFDAGLHRRRVLDVDGQDSR